MGISYVRIALILFVSSFLLTGCWDRMEVNDIAVVVATAIDKEDEDTYRISVQIPIVAEMGANAGGGEGPAYIVKAEKGRTIREAINQMQRRLARQMIFSHRRIFIVGEEVAKDGINQFFDELARLPDNRLTTRMIIAKGKAEEVMRATPKFEPFSAEAIREITKFPFVIPINLKDIAQSISLGMDPIIPYMDTLEQEDGETDIEFIGYAQFKKDRMVGVYEGNAASGAHWAHPQFRPYMITFGIEEENDKVKPITIKVFEGTQRMRPRIKGGEVEIDLMVTARGAVQESQLSADLRFIDQRDQLNHRFSKHIRKDIESFINQAKEKGTDSAHWGLLISRKYPQLWKRLSNNWDERLRHVKVNIHVDAEVDRLGKITENIAKEPLSR